MKSWKLKKPSKLEVAVILIVLVLVGSYFTFGWRERASGAKAAEKVSRFTGLSLGDFSDPEYQLNTQPGRNGPIYCSFTTTRKSVEFIVSQRFLERKNVKAMPRDWRLPSSWREAAQHVSETTEYYEWSDRQLWYFPDTQECFWRYSGG